MKSFGSDNHAGVHEEVFAALQKANNGDVLSYGDDEITARAESCFKKQFGDDINVFFVYNGTGANVLSIAASSKSYQAVVATNWSHLHVDECGAPEKFNGCKIKIINAPDGKLTVESIKTVLGGRGDQHHVQPHLITLTQTTEMGTVYTPEEIKAITDFAHRRGMLVHMDGARISNAAASLKCTLKEITKDAGIDILSFGGTKNGMMFGEAVVFFNTDLCSDFIFFRKQGMQLHSKMRFISAQFEAMLSKDLWKKNATHANNMAQLLKEKTHALVDTMLPVQANALFVKLDPQKAEKLKESYFFYTWDDADHIYRWMTSFSTTEEDLDSFVDVLKSVL